jgi:hypothetical protein
MSYRFEAFESHLMKEKKLFLRTSSIKHYENQHENWLPTSHRQRRRRVSCAERRLLSDFGFSPRARLQASLKSCGFIFFFGEPKVIAVE